ncbi:MAG: hypothetical protein QNJ53_27730 [Pleurocapsa sp. MO_192.B19]|nr:hypothetical protein [Pleurocapsa sp. MO_192.B19]
MVKTIKALEKQKQSLTVTEGERKKHIKLIETTYLSNTDSDYTEKIEELEKNFNYSSNSNYYWSEPEQSMLYGTPLYEAASPSQKMALNHLHWFGMYNVVAASETETITYNQITASVFAACGYEKLSQMLTLETSQERSHIHAFHNIGHKTMKALLGKDAFKASFKNKFYQRTNKSEARRLTSSRLPNFFNLQENNSLADYQYYALRFIAKTMLASHKKSYSQYLSELEKTYQFIPVSTTGLIGRGLSPRSIQRFFAFNWGGSPFLASQYYGLRMMANMVLKNTEHSTSRYFKKLAKKGDFIPAPTAVSHYHFLDESFHTTTSMLIARDLYKDFPQPTAYEKFTINLALYMMQRGILSGLSAVVPDRYYADDCSMMYFVYKILQSPLFEMPPQEALQWVEKCFCHEHEGFQMTAKYHKRLRADCCRFYGSFKHLWPVNREMRLMASKGTIDKAIQSNIKTFKKFSQAFA